MKILNFVLLFLFFNFKLNFGEIIFSEIHILANWIELRNTESTSVDLSNYYLKVIYMNNGQKTYGEGALSGTIAGNAVSIVEFSDISLTIPGSKSVAFLLSKGSFISYLNYHLTIFLIGISILKTGVIVSPHDIVCTDILSSTKNTFDSLYPNWVGKCLHLTGAVQVFFKCDDIPNNPDGWNSIPQSSASKNAPNPSCSGKYFLR